MNGGRSLAAGLHALIAAALSVTSLHAHTEITPSQAHDMIGAANEVIVLDVREYFEFCGPASHIEDAVSLPWNSGVLEARSSVLPTDPTIIVVCASGSRSHQAASYLDSSGYTNVYDMNGGLGAWQWETEPCEDESVLRLGRPAAAEVEINWTPTPGVQDYDLLRGLVENLGLSGSVVDLGVTECLGDDTPFTYHPDAEVPFPESPYFYLARQKAGSWGQSSGGNDRVPATSDCGPP